MSQNTLLVPSRVSMLLAAEAYQQLMSVSDSIVTGEH
jgi:hypothetical protein